MWYEAWYVRNYKAMKVIKAVEIFFAWIRSTESMSMVSDLFNLGGMFQNQLCQMPEEIGSVNTQKLPLSRLQLLSYAFRR